MTKHGEKEVEEKKPWPEQAVKFHLEAIIYAILTEHLDKVTNFAIL